MVFIGKASTNDGFYVSLPESTSVISVINHVLHEMESVTGLFILKSS